MYHYSRIFIRPLLIMVLLASPAAVSLAVFEDRTAPCDFYPTTPAAPDSLTAEVEGNQVTLTWKDNSGDEEGFIIERSTDDFTSSVSIADVDADITTTVDSDLSDGAYSYRVYAYNDFGNSEYSDVATATVVSVAEPTPTPSPSESPVAVISDNILVKETIIASPCAKITVVKEAQNGFGNFTFTLSKGDESKTFKLETTTDLSWATESFNVYADSENGTIYGVTETATGDRWTLTGATCAYAFTEKRLPIEGTSSIQVYPGDEVTCVFTNSYDPPPVSGGSGGGGSAPVAPVTSPESTTPKVLGATTTVGDPANLSKYDLKEQDLIQAEGDHNIYILNSAGYKRLYLNPIIFGYYGDDLWARVKIVSPEVRDAFPTSYLFRNCETGEPKVYGANITGEDTGELHWLNISGTQALGEDGHFFKKVFCINSAELDWFLD